VATIFTATVDALESATTPASHVPAANMDQTIINDRRRAYKYLVHPPLFVLVIFPQFSKP
jgi:hypothetical protein